MRTWSNTHRAGAPLLGKSPADEPAGSAAPKKIDVVSASVALSGVRQPAAAALELHPTPQLPARPQPPTARALFRETRTGIGPAMPATDRIPPGPYRRSESSTEAHRQAQIALFREEGEYWEILYE